MSCTPPYVPMVVAKYSAVNTDAPVSTTTLYTPSEAGDFILLAYLANVVDPTYGQGQSGLHLSWTDDYVTQSGYVNFTIGAPSGSAVGSQFLSSDQSESYSQVVLHSVASQPIQFSVDWTKFGGTENYALYLTLIKL